MVGSAELGDLRVSWHEECQQILVDGTPEGLLRLATACRRAVGGQGTVLAELRSDPATGFSRTVDGLRIALGEGRLVISNSEDEICIAGGRAVLCLLAEEAEELAALPPGPEIHWFYFDGNLHLESSSVELIMNQYLSNIFRGDIREVAATDDGVLM